MRLPGRLSLRARPRGAVVVTALALATTALVLLLLGTGQEQLGPLEVVRVLNGEATPTQWFLVHELRYPRALVAVLVGAALGIAGAAFQSVSRNPLGSPDIIGFTQGSVTGALTVVVLFGGGPGTVAAGAVAGGLATGAAVHLLTRRGGAQGYRLVLVGIGAAATLSAANGYLLTRAGVDEAARGLMWLTGSFQGRDWTQFWPLLAACALLVPALLTRGPALGLLEMGDDTARALGGRPEHIRLTALTGAVLLTAAATAAAGPVTFVALAAPQLARRLTRATGPDLPAAAAMGAALTTAADWTAQHALAAVTLPAGAVTGVLGGLYLMWLLHAERRGGRL
ncbi:iron chelate uptake ABC transporter family permease subunit [Streptomyces lonarensis]|uniref:Iron chelate uptake ABC transporter family permease subunit n=1 Tax=Streptomyces lonarensis TaxID=700599 RepID=A0A7X6I0W3_9ACTN|nr:iron chelate uptake ABC transporter family permease subunit [Streptomyces lonarensis]